MATYGKEQTVCYLAVDTSTGLGKTGDVASHTLRWVKDGTSSAPTNSPAEVDATNCPGVYKLTLTATETSCPFGVLAGKSSTAGIAIAPLSVSFERLPDAAPGASGGVFIAGSNAATTVNITGNITGDLSGSVGSVTAAVTLPTIPSDWITAAGIAASAGAEIAAATWDLTLSGHTTSGTTGAALNAAGGSGDPWSTSLPGVYGAGTAGYLVGTYLDGSILDLQADIATLPTATENADALLKRDMSAVTGEAARSPLNALRFLRNKFSVSAGTLTVTKEDDVTSAWTATVTTDPTAEPITGSDPT